MADELGPTQHPRFHEDLVGLDPQDPEAQAFAAHLDRLQRCNPTFTIEASISGVADFAESSHRAGGLRWWLAVGVVVLILLGVLVAAWDTIGQVFIWLGA